MDIYELIRFGVEMGLLSIQMARELQGYFQKNSDSSQGQANQQGVITEALMELKERSNDLKQDGTFSDIGWLRQFISITQNISDTSMQKICGRILAQEIASPGVTPQRIGQILSVIAFEDMQKFQIISSMNIGIITNYNNDSLAGPCANKHVMVPFKDSDEYSHKIGIYLEDIHELQAMGLLTYNPNGCYISGIPCKHPLIYANGKTFYILWHHKDEIPIGNVLLTKAGQCLSDVMNECEIAAEYDKFVRGFMEHFGVEFAEQKMYSVIKTDRHFNLAVRKKRQQ